MSGIVSFMKQCSNSYVDHFEDLKEKLRQLTEIFNQLKEDEKNLIKDVEDEQLLEMERLKNLYELNSQNNEALTSTYDKELENKKLELSKINKKFEDLGENTISANQDYNHSKLKKLKEELQSLNNEKSDIISKIKDLNSEIIEIEKQDRQLNIQEYQNMAARLGISIMNLLEFKTKFVQIKDYYCDITNITLFVQGFFRGKIEAAQNFVDKIKSTVTENKKLEIEALIKQKLGLIAQNNNEDGNKYLQDSDVLNKFENLVLSHIMVEEEYFTSKDVKKICRNFELLINAASQNDDNCAEEIMKRQLENLKKLKKSIDDEKSFSRNKIQTRHGLIQKREK